MTKRTGRSSGSVKIRGTADSPSVSAMQKRVIELAEQLGRIAGAAQAKTDLWLDQPAVSTPLAKIRDGAADLLESLASRTAQGAGASRPTPASRGRSGGKVDAPGKKHRKAPAVARGVKHSDQKIAKANAARQLKRLRARQG